MARRVVVVVVVAVTKEEGRRQRREAALEGTTAWPRAAPKKISSSARVFSRHALADAAVGEDGLSPACRA
jgi:hypothetical protein